VRSRRGSHYSSPAGLASILPEWLILRLLRGPDGGCLPVRAGEAIQEQPPVRIFGVWLTGQTRNCECVDHVKLWNWTSHLLIGGLLNVGPADLEQLAIENDPVLAGGIY
jgi:hypothetical protein